MDGVSMWGMCVRSCERLLAHLCAALDRTGLFFLLFFVLEMRTGKAQLEQSGLLCLGFLESLSAGSTLCATSNQVHLPLSK